MRFSHLSKYGNIVNNLLLKFIWLELDMPNVPMLDGKSYKGSQLSVSTYLRYVWVLIFAVITLLIW